MVNYMNQNLITTYNLLSPKWQNTFEQVVDIFCKTFWNIKEDDS
jgi:hypothetical protein